MRWILRVLALAAILAPSMAAASDAAKALVSADKPDSEYVRGKGVTFAVSLGAHKGPLKAAVTHLAVGGLQLPPTILSASIEPAGAKQTATLVLRDEAAPGAPVQTAPPVTSRAPAKAKGKNGVASGRTAPCQLDHSAASGSLRDQGDYTATVETCEPGGAGHATLELRFRKKPGTLRTDAAIKLRHIRPFLFGVVAGSVTPSAAVYETSGSSDLHLQTPPYRVTLSTTEGTFTTTLTPPAGSNEVVIPAGGNLVLKTDVAGDDHVGVAQGTMAFQSPELAGGVALVPVEVTTQDSLIELGLLLIVGLAFGIFTRQILEPIRARSSAAAEAWTALDRLPQPDSAVYDQAESDDLEALAKPLKALMRNPLSKPEQITAATQTFNTALDDFLKTRAQALATASKDLDDWSVLIDEARDQPPEVATALFALQPTLAAGREALERQALGPARQAQATIQRGVAGPVQDALTRWRRTVMAALRNLPAWPEIPEAASAAQDITTGLAAIPDEPAGHDLASYTKQLQVTRSARQLLSDELYNIRFREVVGYAVRLRTGFGALPIAAAHADALKLVDAARERLSTAQAAGIDQGLYAYVAAENDVLSALGALFSGAFSSPDPSVKDGKFNDALRALAAANKERALGKSVQSTPPQPVVLQMALTQPQDARPPTRIQILTQSSADVGSAIEFQVIGLSGTPIDPDVRVTWRIGGEVRAAGPRLRWTAQDLGPLPVQATLQASDGATLTASFTVTVLRGPYRSAAVDAGKKAGRATAAQLAISAVVIWVVGFNLLAPGFTGAWQQLAGAFLWGFAADLGLAKAAELAKGAAPASKAP